MAITSKWQEFCRIYVADKSRNATRAYKNAGYITKNDDVAAAAASRLLRCVKVQNYIEELEHEAIKKYEINAERVVEELSLIAFFNPRDLFNDDGTIKDIKDVPDEVLKVVSSLQVNEMPGELGTAGGVIKKINFNDKLKALEMLGKYLKMFTDKVEIKTSVDFAATLQAARKRAVEHHAGE